MKSWKKYPLYFLQIFPTSIKWEIAYFHFLAPWRPNHRLEKAEIWSLSSGHPGVPLYQVSDLWLKRLQNVPHLLNGGATGTFWPLWPWKVGQIKNLYDMWCPLGRSTHHNFFKFFGPVLREKSHFFSFDVWPPGGQTMNQKRPKFGLGVGVIQGYLCTKFQISG